MTQENESSDPSRKKSSSQGDKKTGRSTEGNRRKGGTKSDGSSTRGRTSRGSRTSGRTQRSDHRRDTSKKQGASKKSKRTGSGDKLERDQRGHSQERSPTRVMPDVHSKSILNITNLAIIAILVGLIFFIIRISVIFGIFIFSFIIAFLLWPMVEWLARRRFPRVAAILIVFIVIGGLLFGLTALIIPPAIAQGDMLLKQIPNWLENMEVTVESLQTWLNAQGVEPEHIQQYFSNIFPTIQNWVIDMGQRIATGVGGAVGGIVSFFIVPIIVFYLLLDAPRIHKSLMILAPRRTANEIQTILNRLNEMLNHYLRGLLLLSCIMWLVTTIVLLIFGVKHALLLGVLGGISEVIPIIGPIMALIPALLVSFFTESDGGIFALQAFELGWVRALVIFAFYLTLQYVEGNILVPKIMGDKLNLHPLTVLFALLAGGALGGFFGILLSLPIAASLKVIFEMYYPTFIQRVEDLVSRRPSPQEYLDE